jgi:hypothetical protein
MPRFARGQQSVVNAVFASDRVTALGGFDGIDVADDVGDRHVRSCKFLNVAVGARAKDNWSTVAHFLNQAAASPADRRERIVVDLTLGDHRNRIVEQSRQIPQNSTFA